VIASDAPRPRWSGDDAARGNGVVWYVPRRARVLVPEKRLCWAPWGVGGWVWEIGDLEERRGKEGKGEGASSAHSLTHSFTHSLPIVSSVWSFPVRT
jgi:hypothetical protein